MDLYNRDEDETRKTYKLTLIYNQMNYSKGIRESLLIIQIRYQTTAFHVSKWGMVRRKKTIVEL